MSDLSELATRIRNALGVNASFEGTTIAEGILRSINRLLRDYNFPKSGKITTYTISVNDEAFDLPEGFKKELLIRWVNDGDGSFSSPLKKREGITPPNGYGYPKYYWLLGEQFFIDTPFALEYAGLELQLYWQSMKSLDNLWMLVDFEDVVFTYSVFRLAADFRKPEVMQAYGALWKEDQQSLAIYSNELEFNQLDIVQHESRQLPRERYPVA